MSITTATAVANAMAKIYKLRPDKAQFARSQDTLKFFKVREEMMQGEEKHYKVFTQPLTSARMVGAATAVEETEWPAARTIDHVDVYATWANLYEARGTIEYTGLAAAKTKSLKAAIYHTAERLVDESDEDIGSFLNAKMHQDADNVMAAVVEKYHSDGSTYTASHADAFLSIDGGSIAQFYVGQRLDIRNGTSLSDTRTCCYVRDVYPSAAGPTTYTTIGPGIVVSIDTTEQAVTRFQSGLGSAGDANFDNVVDGDEIVLSGETGATNFQAFPTWFSASTAVFSITRTAVGSYWSVPLMNNLAASATLDLSAHLGKMAQDLALAIRYGRRARGKDIKMTEAAMTCLGTPELVQEASLQVGDQVDYTQKINPKDKELLFGTSGFDGAFWHSPLLGPVSFAMDPVATPGTLRFLEPESWFFIVGHDGSHQTVEWLDKDGQMWHYERGTTRRKNILEAGYLTRLALMCDQPKANYQISNLDSSIA